MISIISACRAELARVAELDCQIRSISMISGASAEDILLLATKRAAINPYPHTTVMGELLKIQACAAKGEDINILINEEIKEK